VTAVEVVDRRSRFSSFSAPPDPHDLVAGHGRTNSGANPCDFLRIV